MSLMCAPAAIGTAQLTSSSISETLSPYIATTGYLAGNQVRDDTTHHGYQSVHGGPQAAVTADISTDAITWTGHPLVDGDTVSFTVSGGTIFGGGSVTTLYKVTAATANTFKIALPATPTTPVNINSTGSGTITAIRNPNFGYALTDTDHWIDIGPTNRWAKYDPLSTLSSTAANVIQEVVAPGKRCDVVAALGLSGVAYAYVAMFGTLTSHTNSILRSQELGSASGWDSTLLSFGPNTARAPDGTVTMDKLIPSGPGFHQLYQGIAVESGSNQVYSVHLRPGEYSKVWLSIVNGSNFIRVQFDLLAETKTPFIAVGGVLVDYDIEKLLDGSYRCWLAGSLTATTLYIPSLAILDNSGNAIFTGSGSSGLYAWGAQHEPGVAPTSYIPTTSAPVTTTTHSWFEHFDLIETAFDTSPVYNEPTFKREFSTSTIPRWANQSFTVTLVGPGTVGVQLLDFGFSRFIGHALYDSSVGTNNYSGTDPDLYGYVNPIERGYSKTGSFTVSLKEVNSDAVKALFEQNRAVRNLFLMAPDVEKTGLQWKGRGVFSGIARKWDFTFWQPEDDKYQLEILGYAQ